MTEIDTKTLKEGMLFSSPLLFDDGKNMFLAERMPVGRMHLDTIRRWNIEKVITYGKQVEDDDDGLDELEMLDDEGEEDANPLLAKYTQVIETMETVFKSHELNTPIDKTLIDKSVKDIYTLLSEDTLSLSSLSFLPRKSHREVVVSGVNIAIVASLIAREMKFPEKEILHLITAALLHDIDMVKQPDKIINKPGKLTDEEYIRVKTHSQRVVATILEGLSYPKEVALIALQHHERWDGKGYPEGKSGQQIYLPARVLAVTDAYEAMITEKSYRSAYAAHDAVKTILAEKETKYDPTVLKTFIACIGLYPLGSHVLLSDGSIAKIVSVNVAAPFFPTVKMCASKTVSLPVNSELDLKAQTQITISRALKQSELASFL